jgi:starch-binding outer membrane protein, SusD/RagB family
MKRYILISALTLGLITGCKDVLDIEPRDRYVQDTFFQNQEQVQAAVNATYAVLQNGGFYGGTATIARENLSPNTYSYNAVYNLVLTGNFDANTAMFNNAWNASYRGIGRANNVIQNIDKVDMNENLKKRFKAEAKFLRALYYFPLWNLFGGAPLILDAPSFETQATLPRNSAEDILTQMLKDLDEAAVDLPVSYGGVDKGRATKGAALAFKARYLLYASRWAEAAAAAKAVMDLRVGASPAYSLFPDYRALFYLENEGNAEVIFDIQYKYPESGHGLDITLDQFNTIAPTPDLVNDYYAKDGLPITLSPLYNPAKPYDNRDPRLQATVIVPGSQFKGKTVTATQYPRTGFGQKKYTIYRDTEVPARTLPDNESETNVILMRYADVLLMYAEAQNEAAGPDISVYNAINAVRRRPGVNMPEVSVGLSKDQMRAEIRHERRIELAGEGLYYYDVRRWGIAPQVLNADVKNDKGQRVDTRSFNPARDMLWPIPSVSIQENPNLTQNPNYGK